MGSLPRDHPQPPYPSAAPVAVTPGRKFRGSDCDFSLSCHSGGVSAATLSNMLEAIKSDVLCSDKAGDLHFSKSNSASVIRHGGSPPPLSDSAQLLREILQGRQEGHTELLSQLINGGTPPTDRERERSGGDSEKRNRVETIISNMRGTSPVNGCKKRKLYQPQQHSSEEGDSPPAKLSKEDEIDTETDDRDARSSRQGSPDTRAADDDDDGRDDDDDSGSEDNHRGVGLVHEKLQPSAEDSKREEEYRRHLHLRSVQEQLQLAKKQLVMAYHHDDDAFLRKSANPVDVEGLAEALKTEITAQLAGMIDSIVSRYTAHIRGATHPTGPQALVTGSPQRPMSPDRKSSRGPKVIDRGPPTLRLPTTTPLYSKHSFHPSFFMSPFDTPKESVPEQNEALSLVVRKGEALSLKKKRQKKVTDSRIPPRPGSHTPDIKPSRPSSTNYPPPGLLPLTLPTSVAIPNPSLHQSEVLSATSPFAAASINVPSEAASPRLPSGHDSPIDAYYRDLKRDSPRSPTSDGPYSTGGGSGTPFFKYATTLTPMHLRKAKLMFFWTRYPSSSILKTYFPDINFNKNNTAQLVKWFSNFREFFYIQMEKYARQALSEGITSPENLHVTTESELFRVLNLHYNRNNALQVPDMFLYVAEQALREFFVSIKEGRDAEPSWKKAIYKVIARLDDSVPEYFRSASFLEHLESQHSGSSIKADMGLNPAASLENFRSHFLSVVPTSVL